MHLLVLAESPWDWVVLILIYHYSSQLQMVWASIVHIGYCATSWHPFPASRPRNGNAGFGRLDVVESASNPKALFNRNYVYPRDADRDGQFIGVNKPPTQNKKAWLMHFVLVKAQGAPYHRMFNTVERYWVRRLNKSKNDHNCKKHLLARILLPGFILEK